MLKYRTLIIAKEITIKIFTKDKFQPEEVEITRVSYLNAIVADKLITINLKNIILVKRRHL